MVIDAEVDKTIQATCMEISLRYEIHFLEIGTNKDHVHFLVQSIPKYSATKIITIIKRLTAREVFSKNPDVKKQLWGGEFWTDGYFISTVSKFRDENLISEYVRAQGIEKEYKVLYKDTQLALF